jgi:multidrug efflux pump subunit AcrB
MVRCKPGSQTQFGKQNEANGRRILTSDYRLRTTDMLSHFFIDRPIFASVLSIVIVLAGVLALPACPFALYPLAVAQYPPITPPSIWVTCTYPGANAQDVADSVAAPIEQQINGVEDMLYMVSQSNNDGSYNLTVTFKPGVNLNFAQVLVQNRINLALPNLPDVVKQAGVVTRKRNPDILQVIAVYSPSGRYDQIYLSNFTTIKIKDEISRVEGVGDCQQFGQQDFSMRVWLDPDKLATLNLAASDVADALREQNRQVAAGHVGGGLTSSPSAVFRPGSQAQLGNQNGATDFGLRTSLHDFPVTTVGRLSDTEEFEDIVVYSDGAGRKVRIKDIGSVQLGARNLDTTSKVDKRPNASLAVWALPDANSIATARRVLERMDELKKSFPDDIDYIVSLDMTPFIQESINEVIRTLIEAIILVAIVVMVFLQNWRSALIPLVAVPVAIIGTFAAMAAIGFSLNTLTMFGLVLAVGIVVDDAIVVVEAVEHHIEEGSSPRKAAHKAMEQVSGPVIAVALVLSAVFVPCAFISGINGQFFRQFALTIAVSTVISAFNSLTLSPALAAILLQPRGAKKDLLGRLLDLCLGWFFRGFNWLFRRGSGAYIGLVGLALRGSAVVLVVYGGLLGLTWWTSAQLPAGYIPNQDQGRFYVAVQLPDAASLERTQKVVNHIEDIVWRFTLTEDYLDGIRRDGVPKDVVSKLEKLLGQKFASGEDYARKLSAELTREEWQEYQVKLLNRANPNGVSHTTGIAGQSFTLNANGSNFAQFFITLKEFDKRRDPSMHAFKVTDRVKDVLAEEIPEAQVSLFTPPAVSGLGSAGGFKLIIEDRGDLGVEELQKQIDRIVAAGNGGHFNLTDKSFALLRSVPDPSKLDGLKNQQYDSKAVAKALTAAGIRYEADRDKIQERMLALARGESFKLTERMFAELLQLTKVPFDFARPVPEPVLARLNDLRNIDYLTKDLFENALDGVLAEGLDQAEVHDKAERMRIGKRVRVDAENRKVVGSLFSIFRANTPQLYVDLNRDQCQTMGVNPNDVFSTLQIYLGSFYVNDFNKFGRTWQVVVQAKGAFRDDPDKIKDLKVRNAQGQMVPLGAVISVRAIGGPINIGRYNMYPAAAILGATTDGVSSGQGIEEMEALCRELLPMGMAFEWTEINYMQIDAAKNIWNQLIFPLAVVFVFLVLAAQYESWALPLAVILVVPMCILGSLTGVWLTGGDINIFTQIGFVVLVGLASKNAILIVEFAKHSHEEGGLSRRAATLAACKLRLRPILMTSFAFILGVVPLLVTTGAGAEMRRTLGTAVFSGMLGVTLFGIFLTPVFFYVIAGFADAPLFASERVRHAGKALLYIFRVATLGIPWLLVLLFGEMLRRQRGRIDLPSGSQTKFGNQNEFGKQSERVSDEATATIGEVTPTSENAVPPDAITVIGKGKDAG